MANKLIPIIKKALAAKYGHKNVSVKNGQGTAWGWVQANVTTGKLPTDKVWTEAKRKMANDLYSEAQNIAYEALKKAQLKFYTYSSDDGFGTDRDEFLLQIS